MMAASTTASSSVATAVFNRTVFSPTTLIDALDTTSVDGDAVAIVYMVGYALLCVIMVVLIIVTVIGNTLVILAVVTTPRLRTVTNYFVMSLAMADFMVGLLVMPLAVWVHLTGGKWPLGWWLCDIWIALDVLLCTASILSLCAISIDRFLAITHPLAYTRLRRSKPLAIKMILLVWVIALTIAAPLLFLGWFEESRRDKHECWYSQNVGYVIFSAMGSFFIPMPVMVYVNVRISCVVAKRHDHMHDIEMNKLVSTTTSNMPSTPHAPPSRINRSSSSSYQPHPRALQSIVLHVEPPVAPAADGSNSTSSSLMIIPTAPASPAHRCQRSVVICTASGQRQPTPPQQQPPNIHHVQHVHGKPISHRAVSQKRENKTTQTLSIVCGGFIVCWLPFFVYYLATPFLPASLVSGTVTNCLTWLGWFNSAMNPFIYTFYSPDFRAAFWRLTLQRVCGGSFRAPH